MIHVEASDWKYTTSEFKIEENTGIDLFDDEYPNQISIYIRYKDGTRFPARTIEKGTEFTDKILGSWCINKKVIDYRKFGKNE